MRTVFVVYAVLVAAATLALLGLAAWRTIASRRGRQRDEPLRLKYLRIVVSWLVCGKGTLPAFPMIRHRWARRLLCETVARLTVSTYGLDQAPLRRIVEAHHLDELLLDRARRARGCGRARRLLQLSGLPLDPAFSQRLEPFSHSRRRCVRFYTLLARLACDPRDALGLIADFGDPFTALELSEVIALLRRGMLPIAYEPLLAASETNFRLLGMAIVRQFGIEEAEDQLLAIAGNPACGDLASEALYTLCALHRPMNRPQVRACLSRMTPEERKSLLRYMAHEGYAVHALKTLFRGEERPYFESLVDSYKRTIVCS